MILERKIKVLTFWTFDTFHKWHIYYLSEAKKLWDILITIVATDKNVEKIKWKKPLKDQNLRKKEVEDFWIVDFIEIWSEVDSLFCVKKYKPNKICLWYDQVWFVPVLEKYLEENHLDVEIVRLPAFEPEKYKSSLINKK